MRILGYSERGIINTFLLEQSFSSFSDAHLVIIIHYENFNVIPNRKEMYGDGNRNLKLEYVIEDPIFSNRLYSLFFGFKVREPLIIIIYELYFYLHKFQIISK